MKHQARDPHLRQSLHAGEGIANPALPPVPKFEPKEEPPTQLNGPSTCQPRTGVDSWAPCPAQWLWACQPPKGWLDHCVPCKTPHKGEGGGSSQQTSMPGEGRAFCRNNGFIFFLPVSLFYLYLLKGRPQGPGSWSPGPRSDLPSVCVPLVLRISSGGLRKAYLPGPWPWGWHPRYLLLSYVPDSRGSGEVVSNPSENLQAKQKLTPSACWAITPSNPSLPKTIFTDSLGGKGVRTTINEPNFMVGQKIKVRAIFGTRGRKRQVHLASSRLPEKYLMQ